MYAKTNPGTGRLSARQKRVFAVVGVLVVLVIAGVSAWVALASDSYSSSGHGCVNVTVASSTGGTTLHYCGAAARSFCQTSFRSAGSDLAAGPAAVRAGRAGPVGQRFGAGIGRHRSTMMVTGPSLTSDTFMSAPKTPVCTRAPPSRKAWITALTRGSATGPGAAADQDGRRPLARSA